MKRVMNEEGSEVTNNYLKSSDFKCKTCNKVFLSFQALEGHRASHNKLKVMTKNLSLKSNMKPKMHMFTICGLHFAIGQALGGHMRKHREGPVHDHDHDSYLTILLEAALRAAHPTIKSSTPNPTSGTGNSIQINTSMFPSNHPYTRTSVGRNIDLLSCGSVKKFTDSSFFTEIPALLKISKKTSLTKSCLYLKPESSLQ
jgi:hypothetical protein